MKTGSAWIWLWSAVYGTRSNIFIALMWRILQLFLIHSQAELWKCSPQMPSPSLCFRNKEDIYSLIMPDLKLIFLKWLWFLKCSLFLQPSLGVFYLCFLPLNAPFLSSKFVLSLITFTFTTGSITGFDIFSEDAEISIVFVYQLPSYSWTVSDLLSEGLMPTQHDLHLEIY